LKSADKINWYVTSKSVIKFDLFVGVFR